MDRNLAFTVQTASTKIIGLVTKLRRKVQFIFNQSLTNTRENFGSKWDWKCFTFTLNYNTGWPKSKFVIWNCYNLQMQYWLTLTKNTFWLYQQMVKNAILWSKTMSQIKNPLFRQFWSSHLDQIGILASQNCLKL